jgi:hypothetical protein
VSSNHVVSVPAEDHRRRGDEQRNARLAYQSAVASQTAALGRIAGSLERLVLIQRDRLKIEQLRFEAEREREYAPLREQRRQPTAPIDADALRKCLGSGPIRGNVLCVRGVVTYFVEAPTSNLVKIGYTNEIDRRIRGLATMSPVPVQLLAAFRGNVEAMFHAFFAAHRTHGEWFYAEPVRAWLRSEGHVE